MKNLCPDCETLHAPNEPCKVEMTMAGAFKLILDRAGETPEPWDNDFRAALDLVTAYYLLNVKG